MRHAEAVKRVLRKRGEGLRRPRKCPACSGSMPRFPEFRKGDGSLICRVCYRRNVHKLRRCGRCRKEKALNKSFYYPKVRGSGFMRICRECRDRQLLRADQRICRCCWRVGDGAMFSLSEWTLPFQEPAVCLSCKKGKRKPKAFLAENQKVCPRCTGIKQADEFYFTGGRISAYCISCTKEYNRDRYAKVSTTKEFNTRTVAAVYHLQSKYTEQELVDMWFDGEVPDIPKVIRAPKEAFVKDSGKEFSSFMQGFKKSLEMPNAPEAEEASLEGPKAVKTKRPKRRNPRKPRKPHPV